MPATRASARASTGGRGPRGDARASQRTFTLVRRPQGPCIRCPMSRGDHIRHCWIYSTTVDAFTLCDVRSGSALFGVRHNVAFGVHGRSEVVRSCRSFDAQPLTHADPIFIDLRGRLPPSTFGFTRDRQQAVVFRGAAVVQLTFSGTMRLQESIAVPKSIGAVDESMRRPWTHADAIFIEVRRRLPPRACDFDAKQGADCPFSRRTAAVDFTSLTWLNASQDSCRSVFPEQSRFIERNTLIQPPFNITGGRSAVVEHCVHHHQAVGPSEMQQFL